MVRWLRRVGVVVVITIAVLAVTPDAYAADRGIDLVGPLPITADQGPPCVSGADRPYPRLDLWRFGLTGEAGRFVELQLRFVTTRGEAVGRTVASANIDGSTAWMVTDPGWVLVSGAAVVSGGATAFMVLESCPATQGGGEGLFVNAPARPAVTEAARSPRALAGGTDIGATVTLGSTIVLAGVLLLVVRRRPRGRHRRRPLAG